MRFRNPFMLKTTHEKNVQFYRNLTIDLRKGQVLNTISLEKLANTNANLGKEVERATLYTEALEESLSKGTKVFMDTQKGEHRKPSVERVHRLDDPIPDDQIEITTVVRPQSLLKEYRFEINLPYDWNQIFGGVDGLERFIFMRVREILEEGLQN